MTNRPKPFDAGRLRAVLQKLPASPTYWVGFSGGADSSALVYALHELEKSQPFKIKILHFNHGLHEDADSWQAHCENLSEKLGFKCISRRLSVSRSSGKGIEAEARRLRYKTVAEILGPGDSFLTAHHREDQAETLLLNLVRGSGVDGLAGMPQVRNIGKGLLIRPLLDFPMRSLRDYLELQGKTWLQDPSNEDLAYDRNFVRKKLVPLLEEKWPGVSERIAMSADLCRQASSTIALWAEEELCRRLDTQQVLILDSLDLRDPSFRLILRHWINSNQAPSLPARQLLELQHQCIDATSGQKVAVSWQGWVIHLFQNRLWLQKESSIYPCPDLSWTEGSELDLGEGLGTMSFSGSPADWPIKMSVGKRTGGEKILVKSDNHSRDLKELLRKAGIPPWLRPSIPLLFSGKNLLAAGDIIVSAELRNWMDERNSELAWKPADALLKHVQGQCKIEQLTVSES